MTIAPARQHTTPAPPRTRYLLDQVAWFNRLRFIAVFGIVAFSTLAKLLGIVEDATPLYVLAGITLALNAVYLWQFSSLPQVSFERVRFHVDLQIGLDLLVLTAVLHFSGGCTNPFAFFFLFHAFIATQVISVWAGTAVAVAALGLIAGLGMLEITGIWPPASGGLFLIDLQRAGWLGWACWLFVLGLTFGISVYFVSTVLAQVRTRDEEVRRLNQQLGQSEKLASIGTLAAGVAHEINNPVGVIRNKTQILRYRIHDGDPSELLLPELDTIEKHTMRIGTITRGLLTFSKETPFALHAVDLNRLVREAAELVKVPFKEAEIELEVRTASGPVWILGSDNHLLQVLVNILLNGRDASAAGGRVRVEVSGRDGIACCRIEDEGSGIAPQHLSKIFDPFFTTKDVDRGTGLGLAISHGIVARHQGTITVQSRLQQGTAFELRLPQQD